MSLSKELSRHFRELHYGGNLTGSNMKEVLDGIDWQQATKQVSSLNTIAKLVFHINYYISAVLKVLQGGPLKASDKYSFDLPPVNSQEDWEALLHKTWTEADEFARILEEKPEQWCWENFDDGKYGTNYRNIQGLIEHSHYHLGQIAVIKKLTQS